MKRSIAPVYLLLATLFASIGVAPAQTIDGAAYATPITDNVQPLIHGNLFSQSYLDKAKSRRAKANVDSASRPARSSAGSVAHATPNTAAYAFDVRYDPRVSKGVRSDYIAALGRSSGARAAEGIAAYYAANDVHAVFRKAVAGYRLRGEDLGDVTAAYFVVMWMAANQADLPRPEQVEAVRLQIHDVLASSGNVPEDAAARQRAAESLMYQTVTLIRVRETAQAQRNDAYLRQLADSAQSSMSKQNFDLRGIALTDAGLVARR